MDIDTIQVRQLTVEEKQKCIKEERCFRCQNTGHRSKECPTKKANNATAQFAAQTQRATMHTSQVVDDCETKADDAKSVTSGTSTTFSKAETIRNLKALKEEDHLQLIDELFALEEDF